MVSSDQTVQPRTTIRFDFHTDLTPPEAIGDAWLSALIVPAMFSGEPLEIRAPVSRRLTRTIPELQRMLQTWYPALLRMVPIGTPETVPTGPEQDCGASAAFFSGGVDSWFSTLRHREHLGALITVKGFDIPFTDTRIWPSVMRASTEAASELGMEVIAVETNLRDHLDPGLKTFRRNYEGTDFWGECFHGACLAAVGLFLQEKFARVVVPASWQYARLQPWGSHPLIDSLLSNGRLQLIHDGADASRMDKIRAIRNVPLALQRLRVCPDFTRGLYNCGQCEKCRRTMLAFHSLGIDESTLPFASRLDLRALELETPKPCFRALYLEILQEAVSRNDTDLVHCLLVLTGDAISTRGEWRRFQTRMKRSAVKRWHRLRSLAKPVAAMTGFGPVRLGRSP